MDNQMIEWADRWRAVRSSPPSPPTEGGFALLAALPPDLVNSAAVAVAEDKDQMQWWWEIAEDPARAELAPLRRSLVEIYRALRDHGPSTDDRLAGILQRSIRKVVPRRSDLTKAGLVNATGRTSPDVGRPATIWGIVPADEIVKARAEAMSRGLRRKHLDKYTLDQQLQIVRYLVRKPKVNEALLSDQRSTVDAKRARREARSAQQDQERLKRDWSDRIKQAEREASPDLNFFKALRQLRSAVDAVHELGRVLGEDMDSVELDGLPLIAPEHWPGVRAHVRELITAAQEIEDDLTGFIDDDDIVTADPLDEDRALPETTGKE